MDREEQIKLVKSWIKKSKNRTVYTSVSHVSQSGMLRHMEVKIIINNEPVNITYHVANILDMKMTKDGKLKVGGCGMDMGFHVVYNLGRTLYPNGDGKTVTGRNGSTELETDGGYILNQRWL